MPIVPRHFIAILALISCGCWNPYTLPDPPPASERHDVSLIPGEQERAKEQLYLEARASVVQLHSLLSQQRYVEASALMSSETKGFLAMGGQTPVEEVLAAGKMKLPDGQVVEFEPVSMLLAEDISQLKDSVDGVNEQETDNRKELFALLPDRKARKIVMIREAGKWVLHRTRLPKTIDVPLPAQAPTPQKAPVQGGHGH